MSRSAKILLGLVAALLIAAIYIFNPRLPDPDGEQSAFLYQAGDLGVARESIELVDASRPTKPNNDFPGSQDRKLDGFIWYPETLDEKPFPLVVYSHGFMSSVSEAQYLVDFLVPKGYVVVAVNYPLSAGSAPGGPNVTDVINQPGDVSFVLDSMLARNAEEGDSLHGLIDPSRIAAIGLSLGGLTTQLVAFHQDLRDSRINAAVSIAGPSAPLEREFFRTVNIPFMMIAGSSDAIVPYEANAAPIPSKTVNSLLVSLENGTHVGFAGMSSIFFRWFNHPDQLVCPMLLNGLDSSEGEPLLAPDPEAGISTAEAPPCTMEIFDRAMRPARQQMLTRLAVYAFLEREFSPHADRREQMSRYLNSEYAIENPAVRVKHSDAVWTVR